MAVGEKAWAALSGVVDRSAEFEAQLSQLGKKYEDQMMQMQSDFTNRPDNSAQYMNMASQAQSEAAAARAEAAKAKSDGDASKEELKAMKDRQDLLSKQETRFLAGGGGGGGADFGSGGGGSLASGGGTYMGAGRGQGRFGGYPNYWSDTEKQTDESSSYARNSSTPGSGSYSQKGANLAGGVGGGSVASYYASRFRR